jgi:hypothetical protein
MCTQQRAYKYPIAKKVDLFMGSSNHLINVTSTTWVR